MSTSTIIAALFRGLAVWPGMSSLAFVTSCVLYLARRIVVGRIRKRSWTEILENGTKPLTGNVWLDGLLLIGLFALVAALFALALCIQW